MVRVLHIREKLFTDGVTAFEINLMKHCDSNKVAFDYVVYKETDRIKEVEQLGGRCFVVTSKKKGIFKFLHRMYQLYKIVKKEKYNIIHVDTEISLRVIELFVCKLAGAKVLILHSHNNALNASGKKAKRDLMLHKLCKPLIPFVVNTYFACSKEAGEWMFPNSVLRKNKVEVIKNSIDLEKFQYSEEIRNKVRRELELEDAIVLGHIGRFSPQKNHGYIIKLFNEFHNKYCNSKLILVGTGELVEDMKQLAKEYGLEKNILFLGIRNDTQEILSALDIFLFPSIFEGFGIVALEAQATGLPVMAATTIPTEVKINDNVSFANLDDSMEYWIDCMEHLLAMPRVKGQEKIRRAGYDIHDLARKMEELYTKFNGE